MACVSSAPAQRSDPPLPAPLAPPIPAPQPLYNLSSGMPHTEAWRGADLSRDPAADMKAAFQPESAEPK